MSPRAMGNAPSPNPEPGKAGPPRAALPIPFAPTQEPSAGLFQEPSAGLFSGTKHRSGERCGAETSEPIPLLFQTLGVGASLGYHHV